MKGEICAVYMSMNMLIVAVWVVIMLCSPVRGYQEFGGLDCLNTQTVHSSKRRYSPTGNKYAVIHML
jgi:hypothetical protein